MTRRLNGRAVCLRPADHNLRLATRPFNSKPTRRNRQSPIGLVASLARPGGNRTGILSQVEGLPGKQVEIAQELVPALPLIGVLANPANATHAYQRQEIETAAAAKKVNVIAAEARSKGDLEPAFNSYSGVRLALG